MKQETKDLIWSLLISGLALFVIIFLTFLILFWIGQELPTHLDVVNVTMGLS